MNPNSAHNWGRRKWSHLVKKFSLPFNSILSSWNQCRSFHFEEFSTANLTDILLYPDSSIMSMPHTPLMMQRGGELLYKTAWLCQYSSALSQGTQAVQSTAPGYHLASSSLFPSHPRSSFLLYKTCSPFPNTVHSLTTMRFVYATTLLV